MYKVYLGGEVLSAELSKDEEYHEERGEKNRHTRRYAAARRRDGETARRRDGEAARHDGAAAPRRRRGDTRTL